MKLLVIGATGQIGWELVRSLLPLGEIIEAGRNQVDLLHTAYLKNFLKRQQADIIINAAAYTAVDKAESERQQAFMINAEVPGILAEYTYKTGALLVHYSTDYVFDGNKNSPYIETDLTCPINVYGQSKLAGEQAIISSGADYLIFRTSWVYAARGRNFLKTVLRLAGEREELSIVADQIGAPTWARLVAETTAQAVKQSQLKRQQRAFRSGLFHLTSSGFASWHEFAEAIVAGMQQLRPDVARKVILKPVPTLDYPLPARRPANSRLSCELLQHTFGLTMPHWQIALIYCLQELFTDY
jgi:dTDP-4-dehydrorhamnose reductase